MQRPNAEAEQRIVHDIITRLWKFNKKYLESDLDKDDVWEQMHNQVNAEVKDVDLAFKDFAIELFNSSMYQLERLRKDGKR